MIALAESRLPDHVPVSIRAVIGEFRERLQTWYGDRLNKLILYGSYARGDFHDESDVDLLIVLNDAELSKIKEINSLVDLKLDLMIDHSVLLSTKAVTVNDLLTRQNAIYHFIRREGIEV